MLVEVTVKFQVEVEATETTIDPLDRNDACVAADLAVHAALGFAGGNTGYNLDATETTEVHVDGYGDCVITWPAGELVDGDNMQLSCEVKPA